jgi:hypothetical protein
LIDLLGEVIAPFKINHIHIEFSKMYKKI